MTPSELFAECEILENRLHTPEWRKAVERARKELGFRPALEKDIDAWLEEYGRDKLVVKVARNYQDFQMEARIPRRFFMSYLACVLSHHSGGTIPHTLPATLLAPDLQRHYDPPDPYFRVWYTPYLPSLENRNWQRVYPPLGFELCWPKSEFIRVATVYTEKHELVKEVDVPQVHVFLEGPGKWSRFVIINYGFLIDGKAIEGRYMCGEPIAGKSPQEIYGLPPGTPTSLTAAVIPFISPPGLKASISLGPGAIIDEWLEPYLLRDLSMQKWEIEIADMLDESMAKLWLNRELLWRQGGRPLMEQPPPGMAYSEWARELYRLYLTKERDTPSTEKRRRLRKKALRQAQREYPNTEQRDRLARGWWRQIEEDRPWRRKS